MIMTTIALAYAAPAAVAAYYNNKLRQSGVGKLSPRYWFIPVVNIGAAVAYYAAAKARTGKKAGVVGLLSRLLG